MSDTKNIKKKFEKITKKLKEEKQNLEQILQLKLLEWSRETLELFFSVKGKDKRAAMKLLIYTQDFKDVNSNKQTNKQSNSYAGLSLAN